MTPQQRVTELFQSLDRQLDDGSPAPSDHDDFALRAWWKRGDYRATDALWHAALWDAAAKDAKSLTRYQTCLQARDIWLAECSAKELA